MPAPSSSTQPVVRGLGSQDVRSWSASEALTATCRAAGGRGRSAGPRSRSPPPRADAAPEMRPLVRNRGAGGNRDRPRPRRGSRCGRGLRARSSGSRCCEGAGQRTSHAARAGQGRRRVRRGRSSPERGLGCRRCLRGDRLDHRVHRRRHVDGEPAAVEQCEETPESPHGTASDRQRAMAGGSAKRNEQRWAATGLASPGVLRA
jgi:hypothetical protein